MLYTKDHEQKSWYHAHSLYKTDFIVQQTNRLPGKIVKARPYYNWKHRCHVYDAEASFLPNSICTELPSHVKEGASDSTCFGDDFKNTKNSGKKVWSWQYSGLKKICRNIKSCWLTINTRALNMRSEPLYKKKGSYIWKFDGRRMKSTQWNTERSRDSRLTLWWPYNSMRSTFSLFQKERRPEWLFLKFSAPFTN